MATDFLDETTVLEYLRERGVLTSKPSTARALGGGVSNIVLSIVADVPDPATGVRERLVVKQALPVLRVRDEWRAPQHRVLAEAAALRWAHQQTPERCPAVVDVDAGKMTITMTAADADWQDWKVELMTGRVDVGVAQALGEWLASWHSYSLDHERLPPRLTVDREGFEALRLGPYHETVARRKPEVAPAMRELVDRIRSTRLCLVHGDFSPKNILVGPSAQSGRNFWVIDFEVAHLGDPVFDLAFPVSHLLMKAVHRPAEAVSYDAALLALVGGYQSRVDDALDGHRRDGYLSAQVGALLLARVFGKSPAEYLSRLERERVAALGTRLLLDPVADAAVIIEERRAVADD